MELEESTWDMRTKKLVGADLNFIIFIIRPQKLVMGLREGPECLEQ